MGLLEAEISFYCVIKTFNRLIKSDEDNFISKDHDFMSIQGMRFMALEVARLVIDRESNRRRHPSHYAEWLAFLFLSGALDAPRRGGVTKLQFRNELRSVALVVDRRSKIAAGAPRPAYSSTTCFKIRDSLINSQR